MHNPENQCKFSRLNLRPISKHPMQVRSVEPKPAFKDEHSTLVEPQSDDPHPSQRRLTA
jgi:hypothetical protein